MAGCGTRGNSSVKAVLIIHNFCLRFQGSTVKKAHTIDLLGYNTTTLASEGGRTLFRNTDPH